ncbi:MAG: M20/M25/M40 family metallo-hydrolase [Bacteroidota bacterium]
MGPVAAIIRSMSPTIEDYPHTGAVRYAQGAPKIPAVAISTKDAELLGKQLKEDKDLQFRLETHCENLPDVESYNVVGEIKGSQYKDEIILVGGHLDSWDLAQGAHDDGTGCVQSIEVLRIFKAIGYKPKRTIRAVLWMSEENGFAGAIRYAELALKNKEKHIAAIESDGGGFTPRGFTLTGDSNEKAKVRSWKSLLEPYDLHDFGREGGGADIMQLAPQGVLQIGFYADTQRYFSLHHTKEDTFDKVNQRELELGGASMAAMVFFAG